MSASCGVVECVFVLGCARWLWKRCTYVGSYDSATWPAATADEFDRVPRVCRLILANYEPDLRTPQYQKPTSATGHRLNPDCVIKRVTYEDTLGHAPPYIIYLDHENKEIVLAVRGLNLAKESDYKVLLDNRLGQQMFDGGYVHHGLLKSAVWLLNRESETLKRLWVENGSEYEMVFAGHSLGSGVVSLLTILVVNHRDRLGGIPKEKIRCYALAPARCMSLNLAVKMISCQERPLHWKIYSNQYSGLDDLNSLPCLLFLVCLRDTFIPEGRKLRDPRRLYAPGRMYHIVERKFCRCGRFPPEVRTAIPVDGRFEHIVLSCNATSDHGIIWIEREAEKALQLMKAQSSETVTDPPTVQKFQRLKTIEKEHRDALERAVSLNVPHAVDTAEKETSENNEGDDDASASANNNVSSNQSKSSGGRSNWDEVVEKLLKKKSETGEQNLERDTNVTQ
ncbi:hypothetical protein GmHk_18G050697 [Glycine max]|uniref:Sn1-specific diacylglycerol lipase alpha n=1 Tax=Glycine soja TaxID=3848 RepID=A0A445FNW3_GLYSO|nr:hypothetical protein GmHk_18G050697 [Glycine max]RZB50584.1 hypothetical protein D0Y65_047466 [Glycine soja]